MKDIISFVNQKGGVGKTTSIVNLGYFLANQGYRTLIIDLDPQGNTTSGFGIARNEFDCSSYDLMNEKENNKLKFNVVRENLNLVCSDKNLAGTEVELVNIPDREYVLSNRIKDLDFDYILIDCPPSLGLLTINALTASRSIIIPVQAEYYALEGLSQLLDTFQAIKNTTNSQLYILGVILTMFDKRNTLSNQVKIELKKYFNDLFFETTIPRNVRLAEAPSHGKSIFEYDKWSKGAKAYKSLGKEIIKRTKK